MILHEGDGAEIACSLIPQVEIKAPLVFIDGDHSYEAVVREGTEIWKHCLFVSILFHDIYEVNGIRSGPRRAIQELLAKHVDCHIVCESQLGHPGMTLVVQTVTQKPLGSND